MQLVEITMGAERKRPGAQQYSSDTASAFVKLQVHPGDRLDDVIAAGRAALEQALGAPAPRANASPAKTTWQLRVRGSVGERHIFSKIGMRWDRDAFALDGTHEDLEKFLATNAETLKGREVTSHDPSGTVKDSWKVA